MTLFSLRIWLYASITFFLAGCSSHIVTPTPSERSTHPATQIVLPTNTVTVVGSGTSLATALIDWSRPMYPDFDPNTGQAVWKLPQLILTENGSIYRPDGQSISIKFIFGFPNTPLSELLERFPLQEPEMEAYYPAAEGVQTRFLRSISVYHLDGKPYDTGFIGVNIGTPDVSPNGVVYAGEGIHLKLLKDDLLFENNKTEILVDITFAPGFDYPSPVKMVIPIEYFDKTPANGP